MATFAITSYINFEEKVLGVLEPAAFLKVHKPNRLNLVVLDIQELWILFAMLFYEYIGSVAVGFLDKEWMGEIYPVVVDNNIECSYFCISTG